MPDDHYDLIVIGSGLGGALLAQELAPTGKRVNPTLTIIASALRVADRIGQRLA